MASYVTPKRATAYTFLTSLTSQADVKLFQDNPTLAAGDVVVIKDGVLDGNIDTLPVAVVGATRVIAVTLSAAEMAADNVTVLFHDAAGAQWCDLVVNIQTSAQQIDDLASEADVIAYAGSAEPPRRPNLPSWQAAGAQWCDLVVNIQTSAQQIDDLASEADVIAYAGSAEPPRRPNLPSWQ